MKHITTDELKRIPLTEGLVLQGCGGNPDDWVSGINELLTQEGILLEGAVFRDIYVFEHNDLTNMLFSMEDVKLDIGKLAIWRLQTYDNIGGTWLSDYLPNRLGMETSERRTDRNETGIDGDELNMPQVSAPEAEPSFGSGDPLIQAYIVKTDDMTDMFTDINRLKDGNFAGKWQTFPTTREELQAALKEIGVDGMKHHDFYIHSYHTDLTALHSRLQSHEDIDEFNYLAVKLTSLTDCQREMFEAVMESGNHCGSLKEIINVTENLNRFDLMPAYSAEQYGDFLISYGMDEHAEAFNAIKDSDDPAYRAFASYIERLEAHIDKAAFGRAALEGEKGVFTQQGYLTGGEGFTEFYRGPGDIPAEYQVFAPPEKVVPMKVKNADLPALLLKIHALGGDYMADAEYNLNILAGQKSAEYLLLINGRNILLTEAAHAYRCGTEAFDVWTNATEGSDTRAFAIHVTEVWNGHRGDLVEVDLTEYQLDILENSIRHTHVDAIMKDGSEKFFTPEQWESLERIQYDNLQNWARHFESDDYQKVFRHLENIRRKHESIGEAVTPEALLSNLNYGYMEKAENPKPGMFRVTLNAAKEMLARGDTEVCRLTPGGPEQLSPLDAMPGRSGLWYQHNREFAIYRSGLDGLDKWANRESAAMVRCSPERDIQEKNKYHGYEI